MKVSVVIRCYNEERHIGRLLEGVMHQAVQAPEIIVVDSGSTDSTVDVVRQYPARVVTIAPDEFSFGRSLNRGCAAASGDIIAIISAHCYPVYNDWLEKLCAHFSDSNVALVFGRQRGNEITKYSEHQIFARWFPQESNPDQQHPFCNNANAAIRRAVWQNMLYDEELTGLEDIDWACRALREGHRIIYEAEAEVVHVHEECFRQIYNRYRREAIALHQISAHEHFNIFDFCRLLVANVASDYYHAWHDSRIWSNLLQIPAFRLMQLTGTYAGFRLKGPVTSHFKRTFYYPNGRRRDAHQVSQEPSRRPIPYADYGKPIS